ncbi:zf-HC2 domain-containing protein [Streptomyces sp. DSM 44915]|uniref:Zf-HC2 domain-containing protein n=1 Tax=Streptomyces chisholmiae TaxID=3075540 RepID=A0ABU2JKF5_9ACTN|nr:zf-HC2 domain-containing protein [Streptomyces sp. DSM 44915]MDT0265460.1 zf-HC2 domain-containing protein [Streptomyces sp. DSM 44915]
MTAAPETGPADRHLGESLAALVDGELSHDHRDRVLAHLATCGHCKAEVEAQRALKNVFATDPLPTLSAGLLARLQNVPADSDLGAGPPRPEPAPSRESGPPAAGTPPKRPGALRLDLLPGGRGRSWLSTPAGFGGGSGFRIHEPVAARLPRGHRLAFAAAGAVSLAAFAIGGAVTGAGTGEDRVTAAPSAMAAGSGVAASPAFHPLAGTEEEAARRQAAAAVLPVSDLSEPTFQAGVHRQFTLLGSSLPASHGPSPVPRATPPATTAEPVIGPLRPEHTSSSALGAVRPR